MNLHSKICLHASVCVIHFKCLKRLIFRNGGSTCQRPTSAQQYNFAMSLSITVCQPSISALVCRSDFNALHESLEASTTGPLIPISNAQADRLVSDRSQKRDPIGLFISVSNARTNRHLGLDQKLVARELNERSIVRLIKLGARFLMNRVNH